jgi:hypothetical protein
VTPVGSEQAVVGFVGGNVIAVPFWFWQTVTTGFVELAFESDKVSF